MVNIVLIVPLIGCCIKINKFSAQTKVIQTIFFFKKK